MPADEAAIAQIWRVSKADVTSVCQELAQLGAGTTTLAIRHMVSKRGLAPAEATVNISLPAIRNGQFAALLVRRLGSCTLFAPQPPATPQPVCIVGISCRRMPPPPPRPKSRPPPPRPRHSPSPRPPSPPPPMHSGSAALYLVGHGSCQYGGKCIEIVCVPHARVQL